LTNCPFRTATSAAGDIDFDKFVDASGATAAKRLGCGRVVNCSRCRSLTDFGGVGSLLLQTIRISQFDSVLAANHHRGNASVV